MRMLAAFVHLLSTAGFTGDFFRSHGWRATDTKSLLVEAQRLNREMRGAWLLHWSARLFPRRHERLLRAVQFAQLEPIERDGAAADSGA